MATSQQMLARAVVIKSESLADTILNPNLGMEVNPNSAKL